MHADPVRGGRDRRRRGVASGPGRSGIVVVGRAERADPLLFTGISDPGDGAPLLVADGVRAAAQLESLSAFQRSYAWITPVDLAAVNAIGVDAYLARSARVADDLYRVRLSLTAPDEVLRAEAARAQRSARRFALLAASSTALLLGFAAIGAIGLRRDHAATAGLLRRRGAPAPAHRGAGRGGGRRPGRRRHGARRRPSARCSSGAWPAPAGLDPAATAVAALRRGRARGRAGRAGRRGGASAARPARRSPGRPRARTAWRAVDVAVAVALVVAAVAVARGAVTAGALGERTDPLLLVLPVLAVVCGGLLAGRVWPLLTGGGGPPAAAALVLGRGWACSARRADRCARWPPSPSWPPPPAWSRSPAATRPRCARARPTRPRSPCRSTRRCGPARACAPRWTW